MDHNTLFCLIDAIYAAASEPSLWPSVAQHIQGAIGGHSVNLVLEDSSDDRFTCIFTNGVPVSEIERYQNEIRDKDALTSIMNSMQEGATFLTQDYFTLKSLHDLYCYSAFYEAIGYTYSIASVFYHDGCRRGWVSVARSEQDPLYTPDEQLLMQSLIPHLRRAFQINAQLLEAQLSSKLTLDALEHIAAATVLLTANGQVIQHNSRSEPYLHQAGGSIKDGLSPTS